MPWHETDAMDQRCRFVMSYRSGRFEMTELCRSYGVSRPTGYKWVRRYEREGAPGLQERSRAPHSCPHRMSKKSAQWLLAERRAHPHWGPRKLRRRYQTVHSHTSAPSRSAIADLLRREGLSQQRRTRRFASVKGQRACSSCAPNQLWTIDYKGAFLTGDHRSCHPLTLMDHSSRYLLECAAHGAISGNAVERCMQQTFRQYGLPEAIHSDNGAPFASNGLASLSRLSVSWLKLGIALQRSRPASPQDNGGHERMHRTLKAETAQPPAANLRAQQHRFDRFRSEYNRERPHEALHDDTPSAHYYPSLRPYPSKIEPPDYPGHFHVRSVRTDGSIKWQGRLLYVTKALYGERVALEEIEDDLWSLYFMTHLLGRFDARTRKIISVPV